MKSVLGNISYSQDQRDLIWGAAAMANTAAAIVRLLIGMGLLAGLRRLSAALREQGVSFLARWRTLSPLPHDSHQMRAAHQRAEADKTRAALE